MTMKKFFIGLGVIVTGLGAGYAASKMLLKKQAMTDNLDDNEDRGVSPIENIEEERDERTKVTADAINRPYKPVQY